jgi:uncharacterized protein DUF6629
MCFSAEADFISAGVIGAVGVATLREVDDNRQLALAALPLAFAAHQATQGFVWLGLEGKLNDSASGFALNTYLLFAWVLLPFLAPLAIFLVEPDRLRRRLLGALVILGALVGVWLLDPIVRGAVSAVDAGHTIQYKGAGGYANFATGFYVVATCGAFLLSSLRRIQIFGLANLAAVGLLVWIEATALTSVWCTWAAIISVLIYLELRTTRPARATSERRRRVAAAPSSEVGSS